MEVKKSSKVKTITIVILIILLLALGAYLTYDKLVLDKNIKNNLEETKDNLKIEQRKNNENNTKISELEKNVQKTSSTEEKNYFVVNHYGKAEDIHVYSMSYAPDLIYAYKGEMYVAFEGEGDGDEFTSRNIITSLNPTKSNKDDYTKIKKLNIKESEVNKVLTFDNLGTTDAQYKTYIIYKNGKVRDYYDEGNTFEHYDNVFKDYKVSDLRVSCKKHGDIGCKTIDYKLTLQDGTKKTVTKE